MADERIRRQIAFLAAQMMYQRTESEYFTAKRKAAKRLCRQQLKPADLPSNAEIRERMSGNICRCAAYPNILAAINSSAASAVRADTSGNGTFPGVPPGTYYLIGDTLVSTNLSVTNIQVYAPYRPVNATNFPTFRQSEYTPAIHRVLQVAANIYDNMTNRPPDLNGAAADRIGKPLKEGIAAISFLAYQSCAVLMSCTDGSSATSAK